jgi:hypothetical protein
MSNFYAWFWAVLLLLSLAWYAVLLVFVGLRGGCEIVEMTQRLSNSPEEEPVAAASAGKE